MAQLGGTITIGGDITVPRMGYGAMRLTGVGVWGDYPDRSAGLALLQQVRSSGVRLVDTADAYGPETNERLIADALQPYDDMVIATKGGMTRSGPGQWKPDGRPAHLREACEASLKRLGVDAIDIYQLHSPDQRVPLEESVGALGELQSEGKVRHIGLSNVDVDQLSAAQSLVSIVTVQNRYNVGDRSSDPVVDACASQGIAFFPWFPIAAGDLAKGTGAVAEVARRHDATTAQVSLAWLLHRSPVIAPIAGTSSSAHLKENLAAAELDLSDDDLAELDTAA